MDPQGRFAPVFFIAKFIFEETWNRKINWDDLLSRDLDETWLQWKRELRLLKSFSVPRWVMKPNFNYKDAELCVFLEMLHPRDRVQYFMSGLFLMMGLSSKSVFSHHVLESDHEWN
ncbi:unnamed protein product [Lepeophtheirus salmonis]|uniref:(salmon louse) hypothetical protein n=1 Tax=Lepeophtheirus salmonis TaxID=72036 RepID=A0A7R8D2S9_LEPSM|nr:unnamed protein product [Lepeophtheirus salmonis]CAF3008258.1 unnamed protein product [Lepeophtheirus salmonis]